MGRELRRGEAQRPSETTGITEDLGPDLAHAAVGNQLHLPRGGVLPADQLAEMVEPLAAGLRL
eukprot:1065315-Lingulodinium_polyedra.AAC.1